jgi:predicted RNA binding protein YcfA (HicA-like mRNA interferase family)
MTGKDLIRYLLAEGWSMDHVRGSHHILSKKGKHLSVPVHQGKDLGKGLLKKLLKEAGIHETKRK